MLEQSVVVEPGEGWNPDGPWWYFELRRQGSNDSSLRLMAVTLEHQGRACAPIVLAAFVRAARGGGG